MQNGTQAARKNRARRQRVETLSHPIVRAPLAVLCERDACMHRAALSDEISRTYKSDAPAVLCERGTSMMLRAALSDEISRTDKSEARTRNATPASEVYHAPVQWATVRLPPIVYIRGGFYVDYRQSIWQP